MQNDNRILNIVEGSLKNLQQAVNVDTVIGSPVKSENGDVIIPLSKVTFCVLTGGGEYGKVNIFKSSKDGPFSAGNGSIVSIKPCGFLIKTDNDYKVLSIGNGGYDAVIDKVSDFFEKLQVSDNGGDNE
ncbi:MAG: hypothetical protein IJQ66_01420 [Clostridia bacterium]|nr:hypothetical protein [Clostridia bacterium]